MQCWLLLPTFLELDQCLLKEEKMRRKFEGSENGNLPCQWMVCPLARVRESSDVLLITAQQKSEHYLA